MRTLEKKSTKTCSIEPCDFLHNGGTPWLDGHSSGSACYAMSAILVFDENIDEFVSTRFLTVFCY